MKSKVYQNKSRTTLKLTEEIQRYDGEICGFAMLTFTDRMIACNWGVSKRGGVPCPIFFFMFKPKYLARVLITYF